ncbi:MAG: formylglycine-generating enzyme family protein [Lentisphaeria bacterium]|nr:formylglycine-generating enzyme family protein [Lentisphaeria bacterium]
MQKRGPRERPWVIRRQRFSAAVAAAVAGVLLGALAGCRRETPERPRLPESGPARVQRITTPGGIEMVAVPAGTFVMGDGRGDADEKPPHPVRLDAFSMDRYEITQAAYEGLMKQNPSKTRGPALPVEQVDWYHAVLYCNTRSLTDGLRPCYDPRTLACDFSADGYRLPTEAEWEYACRAGSSSRYSFGDDPGQLPRHGWFRGNARESPHPPGECEANAWGFHDLHGNVAEWCHDVYAEDWYAHSPEHNPIGPDAGDERVLRGGSWRSSADGCRAAVRGGETPRFADACFGSDAYGFRCVRRAP